MPSSEAAPVVKRRAVFAGVAAAVFALAACCGGDEESDAGVDGSARDAGARDEDSGRDSGAVDGGAPAASWNRVEGLPETCYAFTAEDPIAAAGGELVFRPCADAEGCRRLDVDWHPYDGPRIDFAGILGAYSDGAFHFAFRRGWWREGWRLHVVGSDEGPVRHVLRTRSFDRRSGGCLAGPMAVSATEAVITLMQYTAAGSVTHLHVLRLSRSLPGGVRLLASLDTAALRGQRGAQRVMLGEDFVAIFVVPGGDILRVDHDGTTSWLTDTSMRSPVLEDAANDLVLLNHGWPDASIWAARGRELASPFISGGDAAFNPHSDGADIVWLQAYGLVSGAGRWERTELWTSPFSPDPRELAPRRVVEDAPFNRMYALGHGVVAAGEPATLSLSLWGLTGERLGALPVPRDTELRGTIILAMGEESVAYSPTWRVRPYGGEHETLRIQRYDSLAP